LLIISGLGEPLFNSHTVIIKLLLSALLLNGSVLIHDIYSLAEAFRDIQKKLFVCQVNVMPALFGGDMLAYL